jgi:hypothetical protein
MPATQALSGPVQALLRDMLAYEAEQFDGDPKTDLQLSPSDLVDAFTGWRERMKALLAQQGS